MKLKTLLICLAILPLALTGCDDQDDGKTAELVRGLKTITVAESAKTVRRHFPSVVEPADVTRLSFEVAGKLGAVNLTVGQRVTAGQTLMSIDPKSLDLQLRSARASLKQAQSAAKNAAAEYRRQDELLKKGITTRAKHDSARANRDSTAAQVEQARRQMEIAAENRSKTSLKAPFDSVVASVEAESYANVGAGTSVVSLYRDDAYEVSFSVPFEVVNRIAVGKKVELRLADAPTAIMKGHVSELGSRADKVSAFPVVVTLDEGHPLMKAGMAIEVTLDFPVLGAAEGFMMPLSVLSLEGVERLDEKDNSALVYVFDESSQTVKKRKVEIGGIRESSLLVVSGLKAGERVASAGVSFLRDGMKVKLLADKR